MSYDNNNIFAKILRDEIPCKGNYVDLDDFSTNASSEEMVGLLKGINIVAKKLGISTEVGKGYRALANISDHGGQEVPHLHFHLFGGEKIGKMVE
jgi:histidine triad (HIT) family protein